MEIASFIAEIENWTGSTLPLEYSRLLISHGGQIIGEQVLFYSAQDIIERNETYEKKKYSPGYLSIGDDSGGRAVVIPLCKDSAPVYLVDHGYMDPDGFLLVSNNLSEWFNAQCPVPN